MLTAFLSSLFSFILLNIPIAFSLILKTIVLMVMSGELSSANIASSIYRGVDNFPLMAIPFFMLAGEIMNVGGMSKRIVNFANALVIFALYAVLEGGYLMMMANFDWLSPAAEIPQGYVYIVIPISCALMICQTLLKTYYTITGSSPSQGGSPC